MCDYLKTILSYLDSLFMCKRSCIRKYTFIRGLRKEYEKRSY